MTAEATDNRLDLKNVVNISLLATTISHAPFLKSILDDPNRAYLDRKARVLEKFKRRLDKVRQYVHGITKLVTRAKRLAPISHRWVMDDFSGTGEGTFTLCDDPHEAVSRGLRQPLSPGIVNLLDDRFPSLRNDWGKQKRIHACVHAELRIILHFGQVPSSTGTSIPIGVSKRSCLCCNLWIDSYNILYRTKWMTSGSHGKPYANWALPGADAIGEDGYSAVDRFVLGVVEVRMENAFGWLLPPKSKRVSDEHVSTSGDDSSENDSEYSETQRQILDLQASVLKLSLHNIFH